jgi:hypothetical protein
MDKVYPKNNRLAIYKHKEKPRWFSMVQVVVDKETQVEKVLQRPEEFNSETLAVFLAKLKDSGEYWVNPTENGGYIITKREPIEVAKDKLEDALASL